MRSFAFSAHKLSISTISQSSRLLASSRFRPGTLSIPSISHYTPYLINIHTIKPARRTMTTITLKSPAISVSLPEGFSEEQLLSFSPFNVSQITQPSRAVYLLFPPSRTDPTGRIGSRPYQTLSLSNTATPNTPSTRTRTPYAPSQCRATTSSPP